MDWPTTIEQATMVQQQLRGQVSLVDSGGAPATIAGVDVGFEQDGAIARAAVVVLDSLSLAPIDYALARAPVTFPYVPGFLSFREVPVTLDALALLRQPPDLIICDGQGLAHPRQFGIACHLGVILGRPTIGCAKSLLVGRHDPLPDERGARVPLHHAGRQVGWVLRTRAGVRPVYVSPGHRVSLERSLELVLSVTTRYRLPETTRYAHNLASNGVAPSPRRPN